MGIPGSGVRPAPRPDAAVVHLAAIVVNGEDDEAVSSRSSTSLRPEGSGSGHRDVSASRGRSVVRLSPRRRERYRVDDEAVDRVPKVALPFAEGLHCAHVGPVEIRGVGPPVARREPDHAVRHVRDEARPVRKIARGVGGRARIAFGSRVSLGASDRFLPVRAPALCEIRPVTDHLSGQGHLGGAGQLELGAPHERHFRPVETHPTGLSGRC